MKLIKTFESFKRDKNFVVDQNLVDEINDILVYINDALGKMGEYSPNSGVLVSFGYEDQNRMKMCRIVIKLGISKESKEVETRHGIMEYMPSLNSEYVGMEIVTAVKRLAEIMSFYRAEVKYKNVGDWIGPKGIGPGFMEVFYRAYKRNDDGYKISSEMETLFKEKGDKLREIILEYNI